MGKEPRTALSCPSVVRYLGFSRAERAVVLTKKDTTPHHSTLASDCFFIITRRIRLLVVLPVFGGGACILLRVCHSTSNMLVARRYLKMPLPTCI